MPENSITVRNISKEFRPPSQKADSIKTMFTTIFKKRDKHSGKGQRALRDVSFEVKKGEFFGIIGRNGSGKSTMLKMLAGIYQPTKGRLEVKGKLVPFIELGVGFNPELTGRQNVYLNGAMLGFSEKEVADQYDDIVSFAELGKFMDQKLKNYSSGMQVRLAFSMAVRAKADILLIDEVLAVGDADFQRKCFNYFSQLRKEQTTVIFVSHNMDAIREYCDRAMLIEKNEVLAIGPTDAIAEKYLKLFTTDQVSDRQAAQGEQDRWGTKDIRISDIRVKVESNEILITETFKSKSDVVNPVIGIRIRDASGKDITGTNTKIENKIMPKFTKGSTVVVEWRIPNIFRDGEYSVDPAVLLGDGITVSDWWNEAVYFTVNKKRHVPYVIDPGFNITVKA